MKKTELSMIKCYLPPRGKTSNFQLSSVTPLKLQQKRKIKHQKCAFWFRFSALKLHKMNASEHVTFHTGKKIPLQRMIAQLKSKLCKWVIRFHVLLSWEYLNYYGNKGLQSKE